MTSTGHSSPIPSWLPLGEGAVVLEWGQVISPEINRCVTDAAALINGSPFPGFRECVPAYASLSVYFDPLVVRATYEGHWPAEVVGRQLLDLLSNNEHKHASPEDSELYTIPVVYDGPDLEEVASFHGLTTDEVVEIHTSATYRVYMMGFLPGFAYLGTVDPRIATLRRASPRKKVPAGSVGIAGNQTGIYPMESPGGWQLIGRTEVGLFLQDSNPPCLLRPGDYVQFVSR